MTALVPVTTERPVVNGTSKVKTVPAVAVDGIVRIVFAAVTDVPAESMTELAVEPAVFSMTR